MIFYKRSLRDFTQAQRLMLFIQTLMILLTVSIGLMMSFILVKDTEQALYEEQYQLSQKLAQNIDQELMMRGDTLVRFAQMLTDGESLLSRAQLQAQLDSRIKLHEFFNAGLAVLDLSGTILVDSPIVEGRAGLDISDRKHIQHVLKHQQVYITSPFVGRAVKQPVFHIYVPIYNHQQQVIGFVFGVTLLATDNFLLGLSSSVLGDDRQFYVFDINSNLVVTSSQLEWVLKPLAQFDALDIMAQIKQAIRVGQTQDSHGESLLFGAARLSEIDWWVVHTVSKNQVLKPLWDLLSNLAILSGLLMVIGLLAAFWFIRREMRPVAQAVGQVERMVDDLEQSELQKLDVQRHDELGRLLTAFNRLLDKQQRTMLELREAKQLSDQASKAKSDFLANMSHEIRTPLNAVIGLSEMLFSDQSLSKKADRRIHQIHASGKLLLGIINDVLDFSKIESGHFEVEKARFQLSDVLEQLSVLFADMAVKKGLELVFHVRPDVPGALVGDSLRLTQVLTNLLANAIKFTQQGEVELCIYLSARDQQRVHLVFMVRDSGKGMGEQEQKRLFKAFMQADTSITRKHGGTGLGLVISQRLVHLMNGGDIQVESKLNQGSTFSFEMAFEVENLASEAPMSFECERPPCRALVVDDQLISRDILRESLESWQFEVDEAEDGEQALARIKHQAVQQRFYDVIIMDWSMPKLDGLTALREVQTLYQQGGIYRPLPALLMISAHHASEIDMHADDQFVFLHKPFSPSNLFNAINTIFFQSKPTVDTESKIVFDACKVLVVEDNQINQEVIGEMLTSLNLQVVYADNGLQGVEATKQDEFSMVLMDIQMPVMDGYQATRQIKAEHPNLPVVALTAAAMVEDREKALQAGMDGHLSKPVAFEKLQEILKGYLPYQTLKTPLATEKAVNRAAQQMVEQPGLVDADDQIENLLNKTQPVVLIVDDEPANVKILANGLSQDYKLLIANSGQKALQLASLQPQPDLILLDIMMKDMDGYAVCRALKNNPKTQQIAVIFVSALDENRDEEKGLNLGAVDYISKPFHLPIVKSRVRNHLALKLKTDLLEKMSNMDGLTHIANRRVFDETLLKETHRLSRSAKPMGLIMLDIDYFKDYNDHYGHGRGDMCLEKVAQALQSVVQRPGDLLARYGGEEFVVILPETDLAGAQVIARNLHQAVLNLNLKHEYSAVAQQVTMSLGVVSAKVNNHQHALDLLKLADDALYQAKQSGRNQVFVLDAAEDFGG